VRVFERSPGDGSRLPHLPVSKCSCFHYGVIFPQRREGEVALDPALIEAALGVGAASHPLT
jgi:hypothetical protein